MGRKIGCCALEGVVVVLLHTWPGRYRRCLPEHRQQGSFCKDSLSPGIQLVSSNKNKILDFDPSDVTRR